MGHLHLKEVLVPEFDRHGFDIEHALLPDRRDYVQHFVAVVGR